jgi:2-polyprenyl-3-methyl-5-hydroxy-6-metoxy-1,4-benzoquinol methylase
MQSKPEIGTLKNSWNTVQINRMSDITKSSFPPLVCPIDLFPLESTKDSMLNCSGGHRYRTELGIPRLVDSRNYAAAFGDQWKKYRSTQLDSYSKTSISRDRLRRCLGEDIYQALEQPGRYEVLEAGCGAGRFTEVFLKLPAVSLTSTDLSDGVEPNQENCPQSDRHRIVQCDINAEPFKPRQYDIVVCLGVIQHTRNPEQTIANLYAQVKPGGCLVIDHYTHTLSRYTKVTSLLLRPMLKRFAPERSMAATLTLTKIFFPLHRAVRRHRWLQMLLSRISPVVTFFHALPQLDDRLQYEWACLDTHDGLTDYYKHLRTESQLRRTLVSLGGQDVWVAKGGNGIEARCRRPSAAEGN